MKYILSLIIVAVSFAANSQNTISIEGEVSGTLDADTILVVNNVVVTSENELIISAGAIVKFMGYYSIDVRGGFKAIGTPNDTIVFTANDTVGFYDTVQPYGGWNRITFYRPQDSPDSVIIDFCKFEFSKADSSTIGGGVLFFEGERKVRISNSVFCKNLSARQGGAIYFNSSKAEIMNCTFTDNTSGTFEIWGHGGAVYGMNTELSLFGCKFMKNRSSTLGGAVAVDSIAPIIVNNIYKENYAVIGGAVAVLRSYEGGKIVGSLFDGNTCMHFGGSIAIIGSHINVTNNTIVNGYSMYAGGIYIYMASFPTIANCILWGNSTIVGYSNQVYVFDSESRPKFMNCIFEHGAWDFQGAGYEGPYVDCSELDPKFVGTGEHPYMLSKNSPCINAGTLDIEVFGLPEYDLAGNPRIQHGIVDIGAYESEYSVGIETNNNNVKEIQLYFNYYTSDLILLLPSNTGNTTLEIIDLKGNVIESRKLSEYSNGNKLQIKLKNRLEPGIYIGNIKGDRYNSSVKFSVMY